MVWAPARSLGLPPLGPKWKEAWELKKIEVKGWVRDRSLKDVTGLNDEKVKDVLAEIEGIMTKEGKP